LNTTSQYYATVGGGQHNTASGHHATVAGGRDNIASLNCATVGGGGFNTASGFAATVPGGYVDTAAGDYSFAAGRQVNLTEDADHTFAFGREFTTSAPNAVIFHNSVDDIKVGIGTTSPEAKLDVRDGRLFVGTNTFGKSAGQTGDIVLDNGGIDTPGILFYRAANQNFGIDVQPELGGLRFVENMNEATSRIRMVISLGGNVGIGTVAPAGKLHIGGPDGDQLRVQMDGGAPYAELWAGVYSGVIEVNDVYLSNEGLLFQFDGTERMRLTKTGNLGIGTSSPQGALDVNSTTGALIVPRMTTAQRDALTAVNGMIIYNTTTNQFNFYENDAWVTK
jgi:hypothetical protein